MKGEALSKASRIYIKPSKRGSLHRALDVPQGQPIPSSKLAQALRSPNKKLKLKAQFAVNEKKFRH